jgi:hypothetical protein
VALGRLALARRRVGAGQRLVGAREVEVADAVLLDDLQAAPRVVERGLRPVGHRVHA